MFALFKTSHVEEVVIIVLESEYNSEFNVDQQILIAIPSKCSIDELKRRINGITGVPCERILLLFCGQVLSNSLSNLPVDVFELKEVVDEDANTFRARICMMITTSTVEYKPTEEIYIAPVQEFENYATDANFKKIKHKKKTKAKSEFDLDLELGEVQCEAFSTLLIKAEYYDEVIMSILPYWYLIISLTLRCK